MGRVNEPINGLRAPEQRSAHLDELHVGHINGALGTILQGDIAPRIGWWAKLKTLLAVLGPGLIVMIGDNDAGAFGTYAQAGQNYGTALLWTLLLLVPVLYVNQEMVLRLGAVTGVGHARLILERFGKFWGAFSVIDLFILNALTIITEFIGIALAAGYLGVPKGAAVALATLVIIGAPFTGSFRRFDRIPAGLCLQAQDGRVAGVLFAVALLDASILGAFAVSLSTAYALGDVFGLKHSLHRGLKGAKGFYAIYGGLVLAAAAVVLIPGSPLGLLTEGVQALAGVLLPSAAVYLLLLCNDSEVLGPWVNGPRTNLFTGSVVAVLVALSVILTASVLDPRLTARQILLILGGCVGAAALGGAWFAVLRLRSGRLGAPVIDRSDRENWRIPQLALLRRPSGPLGRQIAMSVLRSYLAVATVLVAVKIVQLALGH